jgi:hypothetical protein
MRGENFRAHRSLGLRIEGWGETRLLVETADGRVEPQNRGAEIVIEDR